MTNSWPGRRSRGPRRPAARGPWRRLYDWLLAAAILGLLILLAARLELIGQDRVDGQPTVNDGDTLTLAGQRIRLRGIDAPEYGQVCQRGGGDYACGRRSREALVDIIDGRTVTCSGWDHDRYGRLLASCIAGDSDLNRMMVEAGWAVAYGDFATEETVARDGGLGLWAGVFDRPRDWRKQHGGMAESEHDLLGRLVAWVAQLVRS